MDGLLLTVDVDIMRLSTDHGVNFIKIATMLPNNMSYYSDFGFFGVILMHT